MDKSSGLDAGLEKIDLIIDVYRSRLSEIKLKRTDTTLDLSQKAKRAEEKKKRRNGGWGKWYK